MAISLYRASVPMMIKSLGNLHVILDKAEKFCEEKGKSPEEMIKFRLIEDMRSLDYQIQSACDTAKFMTKRVAGVSVPVFPDEEKTFSELHSRIDATVSILEALKPESMDGKANVEVIMETKSMGNFKFTGASYVCEYAVPNFHFHLTTAYCILRHLGVPIGAFDYLDSQRNLFVKA